MKTTLYRVRNPKGVIVFGAISAKGKTEFLDLWTSLTITNKAPGYTAERVELEIAEEQWQTFDPFDELFGGVEAA